MTSPFDPLTFAHGPAMANRIMLAPLTNMQSNADGTLGEDEYHWLVKHAEGGFGLINTCAAHVQACGIGFPGQLGIFSDDHLPGLTRLAAGIKALGCLSAVQLHHAGLRTPADLIEGVPVGPFAEPDTDCHVLTTAEVEQLRDDFIAAAVRAERAGFDGVEVHGAHGYVLCQFLDPVNNLRDDRYGGSYESRTRIIHEVLDGIRAATHSDFRLGIRLSPERFNIDLAEAKQFAQELMTGGVIDYVDMSLWDCFSMPSDEAYADRPLIEHFTGLERGQCRLGVAGKIMDAETVRKCLDTGADFVLIGKAAILHHDFPRLVRADSNFVPIATPVTRAHLAAEGLGPTFIGYMSNWPGFIEG